MKRLYGLTNKQNVAKQIGQRVRRLERARNAREYRLKQLKLGNVSHRIKRRREGPIVTDDKNQGDVGDEEDKDREYRFNISPSVNCPISLPELMKSNQGDPAFKVSEPVPRL